MNSFHYEEKIKKFLHDKDIAFEHFHFDVSCHSVADAARAVNASPQDFVKNISLIDTSGNLIVAIVKGEDRVNISAVSDLLQSKLRIATAEEILERTGYPCGGTPSFGYSAIFLIDERVMEKDFVYTGGGSEYSLIKISPREMQKINKCVVVCIRK